MERQYNYINFERRNKRLTQKITGTTPLITILKLLRKTLLQKLHTYLNVNECNKDFAQIDRPQTFYSYFVREAKKQLNKLAFMCFVDFNRYLIG